MDAINDLTYRYYTTDEYNKKAYNNKYDYAKYGILTKCLPKVLFKGNPILVSSIQLLDMRLIMLFKTIDRIKNFKNIMNY